MPRATSRGIKSGSTATTLAGYRQRIWQLSDRLCKLIRGMVAQKRAESSGKPWIFNDGGMSRNQSKKEYVLKHDIFSPNSW